MKLRSEAGYGSGVNTYQCADRIPLNVLLWWPALISGLFVFKELPSVTDPSSGITRLRPFPEAISRISLRIHHIRLSTTIVAAMI
ncbi:TPA: hypothetical protein ACPZQ5_001630 [Yersinia enterocolitica]